MWAFFKNFSSSQGRDVGSRGREKGLGGIPLTMILCQLDHHREEEAEKTEELQVGREKGIT